jgi:hypothetical protein
VTLDQVNRTFAGVRGVKPYLQVVLEGGNHFFLNDQDAPPGARPDPNTMQLPQETSVASTARWTALWFKANLGDAEALEALTSASQSGQAGASADEPHVKVSYITD